MIDDDDLHDYLSYYPVRLHPPGFDRRVDTGWGPVIDRGPIRSLRPQRVRGLAGTFRIRERRYVGYNGKPSANYTWPLGRAKIGPRFPLFIRWRGLKTAFIFWALSGANQPSQNDNYSTYGQGNSARRNVASLTQQQPESPTTPPFGVVIDRPPSVERVARRETAGPSLEL